MTKCRGSTQLKLPFTGKTIRFAPSRGASVAASPGKVWADGSEIYATVRKPGGDSKISVHASGQIHFRAEAKDKQDWAPLLRLGMGPWSHAVELRFLLSDRAGQPFGVAESLAGKRAHLIPTPEGSFLCINLLIANKDASPNSPMPLGMFGGATSLWQVRLRDDRHAVLIARLLSLDDANRDLIETYRAGLGLKVNFEAMPTGRTHVELMSMSWSPTGGNVVVIVPLGLEAVRAEGDATDSNAQTVEVADFYSPASKINIQAPDGAVVASIELAEVRSTLKLMRGVSSVVALGRVQLDLVPTNLKPGSPFLVAPARLKCMPVLAVASPRDWEYMIASRFDGQAFTVELRKLSNSLINKNLSSPIPHLASD